MKPRNKIKFLIVLVITFTIVLLSSCDPLVRVTDEPILLMNIRTARSSMVSFSNFRIVEIDDSETIIYSPELVLQDDENDYGTPSYSASYTWFLEEGASYKTIKFLADGVEDTSTISIDNAKDGMVYYISIWRE